MQWRNADTTPAFLSSLFERLQIDPSAEIRESLCTILPRYLSNTIVDFECIWLTEKNASVAPGWAQLELYRAP